MKKVKTLFIVMLCIIPLLFILNGYSLIMCFAYNENLFNDSLLNGIFQISYLFLNLVILGLIFYLVFRGFKKGSSIFSGIMVKDYNRKNVSSLIIAGIISVFSLLIGIYAALLSFGLHLPLYDYLAGVISHSVMNAMFLLCLVTTSAFIFGFIYKEEIPGKRISE